MKRRLKKEEEVQIEEIKENPINYPPVRCCPQICMYLQFTDRWGELIIVISYQLLLHVK